MTTYIYENQEVELTGKKAHKYNHRKTPPQRIATLVEIKPTGTLSDSDNWKRWVAFEELFIVEEPTNKNAGQQ